MLEWNADEVMAKIRAGATRGVLIGAEMIRDTGVRKTLSPPKSGRVYVRRGIAHQASAPGEAPASDTGRLANSTDVYAVPNEIAARVNFSTDYAFDLEVGTEQMAARPYARPSAAENKDAIERVIADQIAATLGGGT